MQPYRKLKAYLVYNDIRHQDVAKVLGISRETFSSKINRTNGADFKPDEIRKICNEYKIGIENFFEQ